MLRFVFLFSVLCLAINALNAQTDVAAQERKTVQQLSPAEAALHQETVETENFARKLTSLKAAYAEKDAGKIIAYEAHILRALRIETEQMGAKAATDRTPAAKARLEKMSQTLASFQQHAFDPAQPEAAARDFAQLDDFLKIMQEELETLKAAKD